MVREGEGLHRRKGLSNHLGPFIGAASSGLLFAGAGASVGASGSSAFCFSGSSSRRFWLFVDLLGRDDSGSLAQLAGKIGRHPRKDDQQRHGNALQHHELEHAL
jgi:hypothetical protein